MKTLILILMFTVATSAFAGKKKGHGKKPHAAAKAADAHAVPADAAHAAPADAPAASH